MLAMSYLKQSWSCTITLYIQLLKVRVISLVVFTGFVGLLIAPGSISIGKAFIAILSLSLATGACGALNMWFDADIDAVMPRTQSRPIPQGLIEPIAALYLGLGLGILSLCMMVVFVNVTATLYLSLAIFFYVIIYTVWLKRRTYHNIVIGGISGALPPVIGWAAVTNETSLFPWLLFMIIFLWTPPHSWALALAKQEDYGKANIPMLPNIVGLETTRNYIFVYTIGLCLISAVPSFLGYLGLFYSILSFILGVGFIYFSCLLFKNIKYKSCIRLFFYSLFYLFLLFLAILIDIMITRCIGGPLDNKNTAILLFSLFLGMLGLSFASVPLYRLFCQKTGYGGTPQVATKFPQKILNRQIIVRFNADTHRHLPWDFMPSQQEISLKVGQVGLAFYHAKNHSQKTFKGMATYNVTPAKAGIYFNKIDCFCFQEQYLAAGQETDFPVEFFIDPDIVNDPNMDDITTITLSYTFFKL